ncbi:uncharacterized protein [Ambystoma mexicanum]|uniref:uncharacterized protein n=1 Tax=Ambystoma mexicanum TaxID=8296 RepID=UPI0037E7ED8A
MQEHIKHIRTVLQRLREHNLFAKLEKCEFHCTTVEYLGYFLTPSGVQMDQKKVQAVVDWLAPTSVKEIQAFLGFANFYRRFIKNFSELVTPITTLLKKGKAFVWDEAAEQGFQQLKAAFTSAPVLRHPDLNQPFLVETDASSYALEAVLSQRDPKTGLLHPVAYYS